MANSVTIDANRQELWSNDLLMDAAREIENILPFVGSDSNNIVQVHDDLGKKKGDKENFTLVARLKGDGVTGDDELEGNEEAMLSFNESVDIDQIRNAVRLEGKLDEQKVIYDQIKPGRDGLKLWMVEYKIRQIFNKLAGVTNTTLVDTNGDATSVRCTWSNTPDFIPDADTAAGSGNRYLSAAGAGTSAAAMTSAHKMTLDFVTELATKAKLCNPKIQPLNVDGENIYVLFMHPLCARDIRKSSDWKTAQENAKVRSDKNPVFRGALGYWSNVLLLENEYIPWLDVSVAGNSWRGAATGTDYAVDTAANLLCGRQAVLCAQAKNPKALVHKTFDFDNKEAMAGSLIEGYQKAMFNSKEFGVILADAAAAV